MDKDVLYKEMSIAYSNIGKEQFPIAGDFHMANTLALFGITAEEASKMTKQDLKEKRNIGKRSGLALNYRGSYKVIPLNNEAQQKKAFNNYFRELKTFSNFLKQLDKQSLKHKGVFTLLGRYLAIGSYNNEKLHYKIRTDTANYPIQGGGAELLRLYLTVTGRFIEDNRINSLHGNNLATSFIKRIVYFNQEHINIEELSADLEALREGHTLILLVRGEEVIKEWDKYLQISYKLIKKHKGVVYV